MKNKPHVQKYAIIDSIHSIKTTSEDCAYIPVDKKSLYVQRRGRLYKVNSMAPLAEVGKNAVLYLYKETYSNNLNIVSEDYQGYFKWSGNCLYTLSRASLLRLQEKEAEALILES